MGDIVNIAPLREARHELSRAYAMMRLRTLYGEIAAERGAAEAVAIVLRLLERETDGATLPQNPALRRVCQALAAKF